MTPPDTQRDARVPRSNPRLRVRRAVAGGTWGRPRSGVTHGLLEIDVTEAERWWSQGAGTGAVHLTGAAVARAIGAIPDTNARIVLGTVRRRERVDVSFIVDIGRGADMAAVCVRDADHKSPRAIAREVFAGARSLRRGEGGVLGRARAASRLMPAPLVRLGMRVTGFVSGGFGVPFPLLRVPAHPFGSVLVSSLEAWGVTRALPPLVPFAHLGLVVTVGAINWRPLVVAGQVVPRRALELGVTFDHRLVDGAQVGPLMAMVRAQMERPWEVWADPDALASPSD
jgi:hypothetical protein